MNDNETKDRNLGIEVTITVSDIGRYERKLESYSHEGWWQDLIRLAKQGQFDEELFEDMAGFAFRDFKANAEKDSVPRELVFLAFAMKEFAELDVEISEKFKAAQIATEAIYKQGCFGWQRVDGKILKHQLIVLIGEDDRVLVNMRHIDLSPLMHSKK